MTKNIKALARAGEKNIREGIKMDYLQISKEIDEKGFDRFRNKWIIEDDRLRLLISCYNDMTERAAKTYGITFERETLQLIQILMERGISQKKYGL